MTGATTSSSTEAGQIRRFGLMAMVFFGALAGLGIWRHKPVPMVLFGLLAIVGAALTLLPEPLRPVYNAWLKAGHFIGRIVTVAMLAAAFYLVITPAALLKRLFGGRPLPLRPDPDMPSYWVDRKEPVQPPERFIKRF
jgi:hypothetical protein